MRTVLFLTATFGLTACTSPPLFDEPLPRAHPELSTSWANEEIHPSYGAFARSNGTIELIATLFSKEGAPLTLGGGDALSSTVDGSTFWLKADPPAAVAASDKKRHRAKVVDGTPAAPTSIQVNFQRDNNTLVSTVDIPSDFGVNAPSTINVRATSILELSLTRAVLPNEGLELLLEGDCFEPVVNRLVPDTKVAPSGYRRVFEAASAGRTAFSLPLGFLAYKTCDATLLVSLITEGELDPRLNQGTEDFVDFMGVRQRSVSIRLAEGN